MFLFTDYPAFTVRQIIRIMNISDGIDFDYFSTLRVKALGSVSGPEVKNSETVSHFLLHAVDQSIYASNA